MNNYITLLDRWAAKEPGVCRIGKGTFGRYWIDDYQFGFNADGSLYAILTGVIVVKGNAALDWLEGAVRRARGMAAVLGLEAELDDLLLRLVGLRTRVEEDGRAASQGVQ